jgi:putative membrane protein
MTSSDFAALRPPVRVGRLRVDDLVVAFVALALLASGIRPFDRMTWWLEVSWVIAGLAVYPFVRNGARPTLLLLTLLAVHALILVYGGAYTYARVPLGEWMRDWFSFDRNHYDRIGHLAQGFVPAILAREILVRCRVVRGRGWLALIVVSLCVAFSAIFELIEMTAALVLGDGSIDYLATQGDVWDAQKDILCALVGANVALIVLSRVHDRAINRLRACSDASSEHVA